MYIDKKFLLSLIKQDKEEYEYLFNLYKVYEFCRRVTNGNFTRNRDLLEDIEDRIYTINGDVLSEEEKITLETKRIYKACNKIKNDSLKDKIIEELRAILGELNFVFEEKKSAEQIAYNQEKVYAIAKEKLSIIQARLNLPISFLYNASVAFIDLYESEYVNSQHYFGDIMNYSVYTKNKNLIYDNTYNDGKYKIMTDKLEKNGGR